MNATYRQEWTRTVRRLLDTVHQLEDDARAVNFARQDAGLNTDQIFGRLAALQAVEQHLYRMEKGPRRPRYPGGTPRADRKTGEILDS